MFHIIYKLFTNKYFVSSVAFLVWLTFFDNNNLIRQVRMRSALNDLQKEKAFYLEEINNNNKAAEELMTNKETLEKFAREKYLMKRENEDIYLIVRK